MSGTEKSKCPWKCKLARKLFNHHYNEKFSQMFETDQIFIFVLSFSFQRNVIRTREEFEDHLVERMSASGGSQDFMTLST